MLKPLAHRERGWGEGTLAWKMRLCKLAPKISEARLC